MTTHHSPATQHRVLLVGNPIVDHYVPESYYDPEQIVEIYPDFADGGAFHVQPKTINDLLAAFPDHEKVVAGAALSTAGVLSLLGISCVFAGAVGEDEDGKRVSAALDKQGTGKELVVAGGAPTGRAVYFRRPDGTESVFASPGAALGLESLPASPEASVIYMEGFIVPRYALVRSVVDLAVHSGAALYVDSGAAGIARSFRSTFTETIFPVAEAVFGTEEEFEALCGEGFGQVENPTNGTVPVKTAVIKRGPRGALIRTFEETQEIPPCAPATPVVETTGAGDAFAGGFIAARLSGHSLFSSGRYAACIASLTLGNRGTSGLPDSATKIRPPHSPLAPA